jgi:carboxylate-amine ligase
MGETECPAPAAAEVAMARAVAGEGPAYLPEFKQSAPGTMGIELELMVLDRLTYDLLPAAPDILRLLNQTKRAWVATPEVTTSMLEVATSILHDYEEALTQIEEIRSTVLQAAFDVGAAISGGGAHPFQRWNERRIYPKERYRESARKYGYLAKMFTVFGMHVHVGMPSADDARSNVVGAFPMSGTMPSHIRTWHHFVQHFERLAAHGIVNSIKDFYWDVRPKPEYGTIELRVLDTPLQPAYAAALASYARELCLEALHAPARWVDDGARELYVWNRFNAAKQGIDALWIDPYNGRALPVRDVVREDLARLAKRLTDPHFGAARRAIEDLLTAGGQARWLKDHIADGASMNDVARVASEAFERPLPGSLERWSVATEKETADAGAAG